MTNSERFHLLFVVSVITFSAIGAFVSFLFVLEERAEEQKSFVQEVNIEIHCG